RCAPATHGTTVTSRAFWSPGPSTISGSANGTPPRTRAGPCRGRTPTNIPLPVRRQRGPHRQTGEHRESGSGPLVLRLGAPRSDRRGSGQPWELRGDSDALVRAAAPPAQFFRPQSVGRSRLLR